MFPPPHSDGVNDNVAAIETIVRYAYEQGLVDRSFAVQELFPKELLNT